MRSKVLVVIIILLILCTAAAEAAIWQYSPLGTVRLAVRNANGNAPYSAFFEITYPDGRIDRVNRQGAGAGYVDCYVNELAGLSGSGTYHWRTLVDEMVVASGNFSYHEFNQGVQRPTITLGTVSGSWFASQEPLVILNFTDKFGERVKSSRLELEVAGPTGAHRQTGEVGANKVVSFVYPISFGVVMVPGEYYWTASEAGKPMQRGHFTVGADSLVID